MTIGNWKDIAVIATPVLVAVIMIVGNRWDRSQSDEQAREQKRLEIAVEILKAPEAPTTPEAVKLRGWAKQEFERQTAISWTSEFDAYFRDPNPPANLDVEVKPDGETTYSPGPPSPLQRPDTGG